MHWVFPFEGSGSGYRLHYFNTEDEKQYVRYVRLCFDPLLVTGCEIDLAALAQNAIKPRILTSDLSNVAEFYEKNWNTATFGQAIFDTRCSYRAEVYYKKGLRHCTQRQ